MRYFLRSRLNDNDQWSEPEEFTSRKQRDAAAALARAFGGIRTHSYEEAGKKSRAAIDAIVSDVAERIVAGGVE